MNEILKEKLTNIANDQMATEAIRALLYETIDAAKPDVSEYDDNTLLGEKFRSYKLSEKIIEVAFIKLASYKNIKENNKRFEKAF